jgi:hypothetical protein
MALFRYTYRYEAKHTGLGKYRIVSGTDETVVRAKAEALEATWDAEYKRRLEKDRLIAEREAKKNQLIDEREAAREKSQQQKEKAKEELENNRQAAEDLTDEATEALEQVTDILHNGLSEDHEVDWENLKRRDSYPKPKPAQTKIYLKLPRESQPEDSRYNPPPENPILLPENPIYSEFPPEPQPDSPKYKPVVKFSFLDKMLKRVEIKTQAAKNKLYLQDYAAWEKTVKSIDAENQRRAEVARQNIIENQRRVEAARQNDIENHRRAKELFLQEHEAWVKACQQVQLKNEMLDSERCMAIKTWNTAQKNILQNKIRRMPRLTTAKLNMRRWCRMRFQIIASWSCQHPNIQTAFPKNLNLNTFQGRKFSWLIIRCQPQNICLASRKSNMSKPRMTWWKCYCQKPN